ncbi:tetratricopeptide repeat protein [Gluconobacter cerinus]|uniref:tetratricopeptide repeat protein n=1 Tax=Gluconobacter TaxID=441 RepID=UPI001C05755A|nr:tetratricopeptide repeat protein [Gluconobacter sp. P5E10]
MRNDLPYNRDNIVVVDADFSRFGVWAGIQPLLSECYESLVSMQDEANLLKHGRAFWAVLIECRDAISLPFPTLTDIAAGGVERTRNYAMDRAYRTVHAICDALLTHNEKVRSRKFREIYVVNYFKAEHLAQRTFSELSRRGNPAISIIAETAPEVWTDLHSGQVMQKKSPLANEILQAFNNSPNHQSRDLCVQEVETLLEGKNPDLVELYALPLLNKYIGLNEERKIARAAIRVVGIYNHMGYYHEAAHYVDYVVRFFDNFLDSGQYYVWNFAGSVCHALMVTGKAELARDFMLHRINPLLTEQNLRSRMFYMLSMIELRYSPQRNLFTGKKYLTKALWALRSYGFHGDTEEYLFLKVFLGNGSAFIRAREGRADRAIALCQNGYELLTSNLGETMHRLHRSVLQYNTAQVLYFLGEFSESVSFYRMAIDMDPNYSEYHNEIGNIYSALEDFSKAIESYERAILLSAPYPEVHFNLAICLLRAGSFDDAVTHFERSLELDPAQPAALFMIGEALHSKGDTSGATEYYSRASRANGELRKPALLNCVSILKDEGKVMQAMQLLSEYDENFPGDPEVAEAARYVAA